MSFMAFQMWEPMRQAWMEEHRFYIEQAKKRLLSQFEDMSAEADRAAEDYLEQISSHFDPDRHDVADFYESANDKGIEFYQLLSDMRERTRLSVVAGMYYEWDKKLREWLIQEIRRWHRGENVVRSVWKAEISSIFDLFYSFEFDARAVPGYNRLDAMRLVINVFKHGDGTSFDELRQSYPEFLLGAGGGESGFLFSYLDHTHLSVKDEHIDQFSRAILEFWKAIPESLCVKQDEIEVPKWFEKAFNKDRAEHERA